MCRPSGRFSATDRVRKRSEFRRIQTGAAKVVTRCFVFLLQPSALPDQRPRLGVTASRRVGNAVVRNRAKRLVREAFRALRSTWPAGFDLVVIVRGPPGQRRLPEVVAEWQSARERLRRCWQRLGLEVAPDAESSGCAPTLTDDDSC